MLQKMIYTCAILGCVAITRHGKLFIALLCDLEATPAARAETTRPPVRRH